MHSERISDDAGEDALLATTGAHGGDVSSQRIDRLDLACLDFLNSQRPTKVPHAIDIGGGYGAHSKRMAACGADVIFVDLTDQSRSVALFNRQIGRLAIDFHQCDIRAFALPTTCRSLDIIYSQRMLSFIPFEDARRLLIWLHGASSVGARCFLSAAGIDGELGLEYQHRSRPVEERWSAVVPEMALKHQLASPACLYSEQDLAGLLSACGFARLDSWTSPFGNPKVIGVRKY